MIKQRTLTLFLALLLLPALTWADTFSSQGTRWPSGLKKTLAGNSDTLFAANGDILAAYSKDPFELKAQIALNAPEGIITIDYMQIVEDIFIVAACGTGGVQVISFDGASQSFKEEMAVLTLSDTTRPNTPTPTPLNIKGGVGFKVEGAHLIAAMDDNYGYRVFRFTTNPDPALEEVAQQELSDKDFTMLVDLARWNKEEGYDCILTVAQNRELGLQDMEKDPVTGAWEIESLGNTTIDIPNLPSTALLYMSSLTLRVSGNMAHVIENSLGHFFDFSISDSAPYLQQTYPLPNTEEITLGYPLDLAPQGDYACITTLMEKDDNLPGVQVMKLSDKTIVGTLEQACAGALHQNSPEAPLFLMDFKNGLSKIDLSDKTNPKHTDKPVPTPFAVEGLLARKNYLFMVDGIESDKGGFRGMDITNATQPKRLLFEPTEGRACDLAVDGDFYRLFVADEKKGVYCYSLNNSFLTPDYDPNTSPPPSPEAPLRLEILGKTHFDNESPLAVSVSTKNISGVNQDFLHVLTVGGKLFSFPLPVAKSEPFFPKINTALKESFDGLPETSKAMEPFLNDYLLVACGPEGLQVVDLFSDPDDAGKLSTEIEAFHTDGLTNSVSVSSDGSRYAFVADDSAGIVAFDLFSEPNTPALIKLSKKGHYTLETGHFLDIFVTDNNNLYAITDQSVDNILILDVSDPSAISLLAEETSLGSPRAVVAATTGGGLTPETPSLRAAYVADGQGGLAVRQTTDDDNTQSHTWKDDSTTCFINTCADSIRL